jgi:hypothetical protein
MSATTSLWTMSTMSAAANGFVVIADPGNAITAQLVHEGIEWLIALTTEFYTIEQHSVNSSFL